MSIVLRPYQTEAIALIWNEILENQTALCALSTGAGKSVIIYEILRKAIETKPDIKCLVLFNRVTLLSQLADRFRSALGDQEIGIYCGTEGEWDTSKRVTVGSIQSLRPDKLNFNLIIVDECFTPETEVLTEFGFVRFDSLTKKEMVAQFNQDTCEISFCYPSRYIENDFDGDIIVAKNKGGIDIRATKNHEILLKRPSGNVKVPFHKVNFNAFNRIYKSGFAVGDQKKLSPYEKLMIATQADGSLHSKNRIYFSFSRQRKIDEFFKLMNEGNFLYSEISASKSFGKAKQKRRFSVHLTENFSKNVYEYFDLKSLHVDKCREIIEYMVLWDGSIVSDGLYYYSSIDKKSADFYQAIACLAGHSARVTIQEDNRSENFSTVHRLFIRLNTQNCKTEYVKKETEKFVGKVYCVTVPNGNIIIRSRGKIAIVGNCHAIDEEKGRYAEFLKHQMEENPKTKVIGFTATPFRFDGYIYGRNKLFKHPAVDRGLRYFIDNGFLVPPIAKQPDYQIDLSKLRVLKGEYRQDDIDAQTMNVAMARDQVVDALNRAQDRKKIVWFCSSINHAELIKTLLIESEETAVTLHSKMKWDERDHAQNEFEKGNARHLTFVSIVSEGYDYPPIDCIVLMRPTKSPGLMVQTCGRGLRLSEGKSDCLILDYGNVISSLGPLENPMVGKPKRKNGEKEEPRQKTCPQCRTYVAPRAVECPQCGFGWPKAEASKLSLTADEEVSFLAKQVKTMEVSDVLLTMHISKAGSPCFKITYRPTNYFVDGIDEYFSYMTEWGYRKFQIRAIDLGIDLVADPAKQVLMPIKKKPKKVAYFMDSKYPRVKSLIYDSMYGVSP